MSLSRSPTALSRNSFLDNPLSDGVVMEVYQYSTMISAKLLSMSWVYPDAATKRRVNRVQYGTSLSKLQMQLLHSNDQKKRKLGRLCLEMTTRSSSCLSLDPLALPSLGEPCSFLLDTRSLSRSSLRRTGTTSLALETTLSRLSWINSSSRSSFSARAVKRSVR